MLVSHKKRSWNHVFSWVCLQCSEQAHKIFCVLLWKKIKLFLITNSRENPFSKFFWGKTSTALSKFYYWFVLLILFHGTHTFCLKMYIFWILNPWNYVTVSKVPNSRLACKSWDSWLHEIFNVLSIYTCWIYGN